MIGVHCIVAPPYGGLCKPLHIGVAVCFFAHTSNLVPTYEWCDHPQNRGGPSRIDINPYRISTYDDYPYNGEYNRKI